MNQPPGPSPAEAEQRPNYLIAVVYWICWLVVLWYVGIAALLSIVGLSMATEKGNAAAIAGVLIAAGAVAAGIVGLVKSLRLGAKRQGRGRPGETRVWWYLLGVPALAGFVWLGGCVMLMSGM